MVMEVVHEDMGEDSMQCSNHPYKNSTPGGICAFCLQEKLGKLVSSSYPVPVFPSSSSSSSPSFRSTYAAAAAAATSSAVRGGGSTALQNGVSDSYSSHTRRSKLPFVLTHRKKKKKESSSSTSDSTAIVFKRSKSTATPRRGGGNNNNIHLLDEEDYNSPSRRGFWSFLHLPNRPKKLHHHHHHLKDSNFTPSTPATVCNNGGGNENGSPDDKFSDRKVSRSRSVGCGSRSFSGDFFERISTGFGDCTLRRVESQREGKPKNGGKNGGGMNGQDYIKERVKCGGLFSGFMIAGSSSSSSSSSSYWVAGNSVEENSKSQMVNLSHGRSKSWGWAFASPMRAFSKNININNNSGKRDADLNSNKNRSPNLSAIPSLLAVSG